MNNQNKKSESSQLDKSSLINQDSRLYYLDWLRIITIIAVFLHHCSRIFDNRSTQLYNAAASLRRQAPAKMPIPVQGRQKNVAAFHLIESAFRLLPKPDGA